jgi:hypothetical protein
MVRRLLTLTILLALIGAGSALAARGDPQKKITPADQARAKAMLLRQSDFGPGFQAQPAGGDYEYYCKALDESDLTLTGEAESPTFTAGLQGVGSASQVYASVANASTSWRRGTSSAGVACAAAAYRSLTRGQGVRFVSYRKIAFPSVAPRTVAYRWLSTANGVRVFADLVFLMRSRAQAAVYFVSPVAPVSRVDQVRYVRLVDRRMAKAMRGA